MYLIVIVYKNNLFPNFFMKSVEKLKYFIGIIIYLIENKDISAFLVRLIAIFIVRLLMYFVKALVFLFNVI